MTYVEIAELVFNSQDYFIWTIAEYSDDKQYRILNGQYLAEDYDEPVNMSLDYDITSWTILFIAAMEGEI